jgi:hypothetical protein
MKKELMNLFLFIGICFLLYLLFRNFNYNLNDTFKEGMQDASSNQNSSSSNNGIAGNAASYGATIKESNIRFQDQFLITKYRSDYEAIILDLDDSLNNIMLNTILTGDANSTEEKLIRLGQLNQSKEALNNVMKFIDKN